jgi:precorrin-6B methylase 2
MSARKIASEEWTDFFDTFSRHYRGRPVQVQIMGEKLRVYSIARSQPLIGITTQDKAGPCEIEVIAGDTTASITHVVRDPAEVWMQQGNNGVDSVLKIASKDGTSILIDFRSPNAAKGGRT